MRSSVQTITPEKAREFLERNIANRPLSTSVVQNYAEAIKRGEWQTTHQGIAFDEDGNLVDGQHRLQAVAQADQAVEMVVFSDVDPATFQVLDTGKGRSASDIIASVTGEKNTAAFAAALRLAVLYDTLPPDAPWSGRQARLSNTQLLYAYEEHGDIREFLEIGGDVADATGMIKTAAVAGAYLTQRANPTLDTDNWYDGVVDGVGLSKRDPRLTFRNTMNSLARREAGRVMRRRDSKEHLALYIKAFNGWLTGRDVTPLRYGADEEMPRIAQRARPAKLVDAYPEAPRRGRKKAASRR